MPKPNNISDCITTHTLAQKEPFLDALKRRILLFDGAMGTEIQKLDPKPEDFPNGKDGFNDGLVLTHPEWIRQIHRSYLDAGADCIETNSFGSNRIKLDEYGFGNQTVGFNQKVPDGRVQLGSWRRSGIRLHGQAQIRDREHGPHRIPAQLR